MGTIASQYGEHFPPFDLDQKAAQGMGGQRRQRQIWLRPPTYRPPTKGSTPAAKALAVAVNAKDRDKDADAALALALAIKNEGWMETWARVLANAASQGYLTI